MVKPLFSLCFNFKGCFQESFVFVLELNLASRPYPGNQTSQQLSNPKQLRVKFPLSQETLFPTEDWYFCEKWGSEGGYNQEKEGRLSVKEHIRNSLVY